MLELKTNKKAFDSQRNIYKALRQVLKTKPLIDITVQDVCTECQISRSSFYRNFKNVIDVLDVLTNYFYSRYIRERVGQKDQVDFFFEYWINHRDLINILKNQNIDILRRVMISNDPPYVSKLELEMRLSVFTTVLGYWSGHHELSKDEMKNLTLEFANKEIVDSLLKM